MRFRKIYFIPFFLFFILLTSFSYPDKSGWKLEKNETGIEVYTRLHDSTAIKEIRVVDTVKSSLSGIVALLLDTKNYPNWIYACKEAHTVKTIDELEIFQYHLTSVPPPFQNRDMILNLKITQDRETKIINTESTCKSDFMPVIDGIERIKNYYSHYTLTPLNGGRVMVEFEMYVEPGGNVPKWLINATIVKGPFSTTVAMAEELKKTQYQNAMFSAIKEMR